MAANSWPTRAAPRARRPSWPTSDRTAKLQRIEKVLEDAQFHRIRQGMHKDEVLRILGPSGEEWTQFYSRRNELAWSWLFCNSWSVQEFFDVMFDADTGIVRSTGRHPDLKGPDGKEPSCGH
jgi:hypothetical protein